MQAGGRQALHTPPLPPAQLLLQAPGWQKGFLPEVPQFASLSVCNCPSRPLLSSSSVTSPLTLSHCTC